MEICAAPEGLEIVFIEPINSTTRALQAPEFVALPVIEGIQ